jgi:uncharacterized protein YdaU (DUF1376 family)
MKARPWYRRYPDNFITGTVALTLEEKGAYSLVLDLIYARGGPIADEPRWIAGVCNCSVRKWKAIRERLLALGKLVSADGELWNEKALEELRAAHKQAEKLAENGSKGGNKSAEIKATVKETNDLAQAGLNHIQSTENRTPIVPEGTARRKKAEEGYGDPTNPLFADFQSRVWSKRWERPNNPPLPAFKAYAKLPETDRAACGAAIERCARAISAEASEPKYRPMLATWINRRGWEAEAVAPAPAVDWSKRMAYWRSERDWPLGWGPHPGDPGCIVPREFLMAAAG